MLPGGGTRRSWGGADDDDDDDNEEAEDEEEDDRDGTRVSSLTPTPFPLATEEVSNAGAAPLNDSFPSIIHTGTPR